MFFFFFCELFVVCMLYFFSFIFVCVVDALFKLLMQTIIQTKEWNRKKKKFIVRYLYTYWRVGVLFFCVVTPFLSFFLKLQTSNDDSLPFGGEIEQLTIQEQLKTSNQPSENVSKRPKIHHPDKVRKNKKKKIFFQLFLE
jgi:hypothetical protein